MIQKIGFKTVMLGSVLALSACGAAGTTSSSPEAGPPKETPKEPYTLLVYTNGVKKEEFDSRYKAMLDKKFPHITIKYVQAAKGSLITDLLAQKEVPDLMRIDNPTLHTDYLDLGLGLDLTPFVQKYKYDLKRFEQVFLNEIVETGRTGELYGLPVPPYFPMVLYYNKSLFDKFGVPYPKDGMSWDEIYDLAKRMTRTEGGTVYRGFNMNTVAALRDNVYSLPILDPKADRLAEPEKWLSMFNNYLRFYQIPGNAILNTSAKETNVFTEGKVALSFNQYSPYLTIPPELEWDMVSNPAMAGAPKKMSQRGPAYWAITKQSKHQDEAFQIIMEMLSDDLQMEDSKRGFTTTLINKEVQNALGSGSPVMSSKNNKAIYFYEPASYTPKRQPGSADVPGGTQQNLMAQSFIDVASGINDANTGLRGLEEKLKQEIDKVKNK